MIHTSDTCCHGDSLVEDPPLLIQYPSPGDATPKTFGTFSVYNLRYDRWCCSAHIQCLCFLPLNPYSFLLRHLLLLFLLRLLQHSVLHPHSHHWSCYHRMHVSFVILQWQFHLPRIADFNPPEQVLKVRHRNVCNRFPLAAHIIRQP